TSLTATPSVTATGSLFDIISKTSHLSLLNTAMIRAGLSESFKSGSLTLFAPTDEAFKAAGYTNKSAFDTLPVADLKQLLQYHVLNTRLSASSLPAGTSTSVPTALVTATVSLFKAADGQLYANAGRVVQPDIGANNSVMYVLDNVLPIPSQTTVELLRTNAGLSFFRLAVERVGNPVSAVLLSPTERGITVFAPSNAAFRAAGFTTEDAVRSADVARLTEIMRYHIINSRAFSPTLRTGELTTVQGTPLMIAINPKGTTVTGKGNPAVAGNLLQTDLTSTNGVVHVIDRVLLPTGVSQ
ncbi:MAG: fasciclin domain-containing protein, partial [Rudanella sp.]|nr:fasciclin domain-containing protein [Rudanella sp.]